MPKRRNKALKSKRRVPIVENLEPRILLSADFPGLDAVLPASDDLNEVDTAKVLADARAELERQLVEKESKRADEATVDVEEQQPVATTTDSAPTRHELVIVDPGVPAYEELLADLQINAADDTTFEVVVLDPKREGLEQVSALLSQYIELDAVHLISHGSDGTFQLAGHTVDLATVEQNADVFRVWGNALSADGDILIYGCDLAASEAGEALVDTLAALTGADVAASDDLTGHASLGGDWELEYHRGQVETTVAVSAVTAHGWNAVLPTYPASNGTWNDEEWITNVNFGDIDNTSGQDSGGYGDYTSQSTTVTRGSSTDLSVTISLISATPDDFITAWVDWNQDGDFEDPDEEFVIVENTVTNGPHTASITVPNDAVLGSTQMRVSLKYFSAPPSFGTFNWGEVEDYTVNVAAAGNVNQAPINTMTPGFAVNTLPGSVTGPAAVGTGDFDGDGDIDLVAGTLGDTSSTSLSWYRNDGSENFTQLTITTGGMTADTIRDLDVADVDGDGDLDIVTVSQLDDKVSWWQNNGPGSFTQNIAGTLDNARSVDVVDFDQDGDVDIIAGGAGTTSIRWFDNDGSETFTAVDVTTSATASQVTSVQVADIDGDSDLDIVAAGFVSDNFLWFEHLGGGSFTTHTIDSGGTVNGAAHVSIADINGDGALDIATVSNYSNTVSYYQNDGAGNFGAGPAWSVTANGARSVAAGDIDQDGDVDIVAGSVTDGNIVQHVNDGAVTPGFDAQTISSTSAYPLDLELSDIDGDGDLDLVEAAYSPDDEVRWYENRNGFGLTATTAEDTPLTFSAATGNQISVSDPDAGSNPLQITLNATNGSVTLSQTTGLTFSGGTGTDDATMTFTGTISNINAALDGLVFSPVADFTGSASLQIVTNDLGNTGSGGAQSDTDTVTIDVTPVNDDPTITSSATVNVAEGQTAVTTVTASDVDGDNPTFSITGGADQALFSITAGGVLTFNVARDFEDPTDANSDGVYEVEVTADDGNTGTDAQTISVTVTDANDAPVFIEGGVGYWQFDEGSGATTGDSTYASSVGTLGSTAGADANDPVWTAGRFGQALQFDGVDDYVEVADAPELDISGPEFSASLWINPSRAPNTEDMFFMKGDRTGDVNYYLSWKDTGDITWAFKRDGENFDWLNFAIPPAEFPAVGEWTHIAVVFDRPTVSLYVNGTEYAFDQPVDGPPNGGSMDRDLTANSDALLIGAGRSGGSIVSSGFSTPFAGLIDDFAIYDRALTDAEIETIRTSQPAAAAADTFLIVENSAFGTLLGTVAASEQDVGDTLSYAITAGNTGGAFAIDNNGLLTVNNSAALDFETNPSFALTVEVNDGNGGVDTQLVGISVTNVQPIISAAGNASVDEDAIFTLNLTADEHVDNWTINWGDGAIDTVAGTATTATHTYSNGGYTNNITVSATDSDGTVLESGMLVPGLFGTERLYRLDVDGDQIDNIATGTGLGWSLSAIVGPDGSIYVGSYTTDDIRRYDPATGNYLGVFVAAGAGGLDGPAGMEFGPDGHLYVASNFGDEILKYDAATGAFLGTFVSFQSGGMDEPDDITFGPDGDLYVTSFNTDEVLRYDGFTGEFKEVFVAANAGGLNAPSELTFGPDGNLYVTSVVTDQVLRFNGTTGAFIDVFASGMGMDQPRGAVFGPDGHLYVADRNSVFKFDGTTPSGGITPSVYATSPDVAGPSQIVFLPSHQVAVNAINDAPVVSAPGSALGATEQTNLSIEGAGFSVDDVDAGMGTATATLNVGEGILTVAVGDSGVTIDSGDGTGTVTLSGRVSDIDKLLTGTSTGTITYFNGSDNPSTSTTLTATVNDGGGTGADPGLTGTPTTEQGSNSVTINITATNDAATIGGVDTGSLTEDAGAVDGYLNASGTLTATDIDNPDDTFTAATHRGSLGDLTIDGSGNWTYSVDNSLPAIQGLAAGGTLNDVITVSSIDGTTHDITITITGNAAPTAVNDAYTVTEDGTLAVDWWDSDWSRRSAIAFDNSGQGETFTDMPVLVVLNSGNIDYALTNNDGSDLRFFDTGGNALAYDIEEWNESGDSYVWVKVPQVTGGSNTDTITMYWGNASAASAENASAVWSNGYAAVHHLQDDFNDATVQRNTGTNSGSADTDGQVGDGQLFDGVDDFVSLGDDPSIQNIFSGGGTVSAWIYATGWGEGDYGRIFDKSGNTLPSNSGWALELFGGAQNALLFQVGHSGTMGQWYTGANSISLNAWTHVSLSYDASNTSNVPEIYINGVLQTLTSSQPTGTLGSDAGYDLTVGNHAADTTRTFDGTIDNVQISSTARSGDWIKAQYLSSSGLFASVGAAESVGTTTGLLDNDTAADPHTPRATNLDTTGTVGLVTLNDDGSFSYDTNGQFAYLAAGVDATDTFSYTLDDGVNPPTVATVTITVTGANDDPLVTFGEGNKSYTENAPGVIIDASIAVTDPDSADLDGGTLTVSLTANGSPEDRLAITNEGTGPGQVGQSGSDVTYNFGAGAVVIGTVSGGTSGGDPLVITFNANSTPAAVTEVARQVAYMAMGDNPSAATRTVEFVVTDGDGGTSVAVSKDISVVPDNDAPVLGTNALTITEGGGVTLSAANLVATDVDDADAGLAFTVSNVTGGQFIRISTGATLTSFTQADVTAGDVYFRHDGGDAAPGYDVSVSDGVLSDGPQAAAITFTNVNDAPVNHFTPQPQTVASNSIDGVTDIHAADLNGDGDIDLVSSSYGDDRIVWYENDGAGNLTAIDVATGVLGAREVFVADVDNDGHMDILSAAYQQESIVWYENDGAVGTPTFTAHTIALGEGQASTVFAADLDNDGDTDVLAGYQDTDEVVWYENDGLSFTRNVITNATNGVKSVVAGDLDGDGDVDVAAVSYVGDTVDWFENDGVADPTFTHRPVTTSLLGQMSMEIADVDGDGADDLVVASYFDGKIAWYKNDGSPVAPTFSENIVSTSADGARDVEVADLDGDGDADIVAASYSENEFAWYESDGASSPTFAERAIALDAGGPRAVAVADMDGDMDLDVVGAAYAADEVGYFENTDGSMGMQTTAEDTPLTFDAANGNLVWISDVDAGALEMKVRLEASNGLVSLSGTTGLTLDIGSGTDDAIVEFRGSVAAINAALDGLVFTPDADFAGIASIRIITDDQGNTGIGGAEIDDDTINITVTPVNDAPVARPDGVHLSFDGNDIVRVVDHPSLQMTNNVTMEAWINPAGVGTGSQLILNKEGEYELGIIADTGQIIFAIARPDNTWAWHYTGQFVTLGEWSHVAVTYDGVAGEARTYINGELVDIHAQSGAVGDVYSAFDDLTIGGRGNDALERFEGQIDEVRVWSSTRTQGDIQANMDGQLTGAEVSLVGNWRLDEAAGGAVIDQSAFGNDGVLGGGEGAAAIPSYQGYVTDQNTVLSIPAGSGVLANDFDIDSGSLTVTNLDTIGMLGNLVLNAADGSFSYDPNGAFDYLDVGEQATETFTYTANDGSSDSNVVTVTITVTGVEDAPVITATSTGTVAEDGTLTANGTLAITDVDTNDNPIDFPDEGSTPGDNGYGDFALVGGIWTYTLNNAHGSVQALDVGQSLTDTHTFTASDGISTQLVTITINGAEDAPVITATSTGTVAEDGTLTANGTLSITDVDSNDNPIDFPDEGSTLGDNGYGNFQLIGGTWTYTLNNSHASVQALDVGQSLTDTHTFTASDGISTQLVTITINGAEDAPVITATSTGTVAEDGTLTANGTLAITDVDTNDNPIDFPDEPSTLGDNGYGDFQLVGGTWTYTLNNAHASVQALDVGQSLTDTHTFIASDGISTQLVTITINGAEDGPTLDFTIPNQTATEGTPFSFAFAANTFNDVDATDTLTYTATLSDDSPLPAWLTFNDATRTFSGTPANGDVGTISVKVTADDGSSTVFDVFDITVNNVNNPPVFGGVNSGSVTEDVDPDVDTLLEVSGTLTIADPDVGESSFQAATVGGTYGTLTIDTAGNWSYEADNTQAAIQQLDAGQSVNDVLTVNAFDGSPHTVTITINGAEDAPVITATSTGTVAEDGTLTANGTLSVTDVDSNDNPIDFPDESSTLGDNGYGNFQLVGGTWTYTLNNAHASVQALDVGQSLTDTHTFTASDGISTQLVTITINGAEDTPVITATSTGTVAEDGTLTANGTLSITDVDTNDNPIDFPDEGSTLGDNGYGDFQLVGGTWTYTLNNAHASVQALDVGQSLTDTHTFTASDGISTQVVTIAINGAEDAPVITATSTGTVAEDGTLTANGTLSITDVDTNDNPIDFPDEGSTPGDNGYGDFALVGGTWTYTLNNAHASVQALDVGQSLTDTHTFTASDGISTQVVTITIDGAEDAPVISVTSTGTVAEDGTLTANGTLSITDVDTNDNPIGFASAPTPGANGFGSFTAGGGSWTYTLNNSHAAVQALDVGQSLTDTRTFTASDGVSTQSVTVTINGAEDAPVITATATGGVVKDATLTANGTLGISDVDSNDNPVSFPDVVSTAGDNGYGDFQLTAGTWTYALNNAHAAVQALGAGQSLTDTHTFTATDGSTQLVTITIAGATVPPPEPLVEPPEPPAPPEPEEDPVEPPVTDEGEPPPDEEPEDPAAEEVLPETAGQQGPVGDPTDVLAAFDGVPGQPLPTGDVLLSVISDRDRETREIASVKPTPEAARTFLQELKSFWNEPENAESGSMLDGARGNDFWNDVDEMLRDFDKDARDEESREQLTAEAMAGVSLSLTAGFVSWALRAGSMAASFLAAMPAWRNFDPMPVLASDEKERRSQTAADDDRAEADHDDNDVDQMFDR